jgi:hypothetical protein
MCCITLTALEATMATTEATRDVNYEVRTPWLPQRSSGTRTPRMNWVVVTGENGVRQLRTNWNAAQDD